MKDFFIFKVFCLLYEFSNDKCLFFMFILLFCEKNGLVDLEKVLDLKILIEDFKYVNEVVCLIKFVVLKFKVFCGFEVL